MKIGWSYIHAPAREGRTNVAVLVTPHTTYTVEVPVEDADYVELMLVMASQAVKEGIPGEVPETYH